MPSAGWRCSPPRTSPRSRSCASRIPDEDYTRKGLTGLGPNDQERWYLDPRLDDKFQIPDVFFTKDRKAFDKGHIVRRDDVAWGTTYDSPAARQRRQLSRDQLLAAGGGLQPVRNQGEDNWGDLENHVLSEAANERLCVFAGPVLDPADEVFVGKGDGGTTLRAKIPSRFWKVIVSRVDDGIAAYGFVLEQDLSEVEFRSSPYRRNSCRQCVRSLISRPWARSSLILPFRMRTNSRPCAARKSVGEAGRASAGDAEAKRPRFHRCRSI